MAGPAAVGLPGAKRGGTGPGRRHPDQRSVCRGAGQASVGTATDQALAVPAAGPEPVAAGGCLPGFALAVTGGLAVCSWHAADPAQSGPAADPRLAGLRTELARRFSEPRATLNARLRAIADCLPPPDPRELHLTIDSVCSERWVLLRTGGAVIACTVADVSGMPLPVAIALASSSPGGGPGSSAGRESPGSMSAAPWSASRGCAV